MFLSTVREGFKAKLHVIRNQDDGVLNTFFSKMTASNTTRLIVIKNVVS